MPVFDDSPWVKAQELNQENLYKYGEVINYSANSFIYYQGDNSQYLYYLVEGRVKVAIISSEGGEKTLAIHEPGSFFGETSFF